MGQFMRYLPLTLILTRMASLFVALVINPVLCTLYVHPQKKKVETRDGSEHPILDAYEAFLRGALRHRRMVMLIGGAFPAPDRSVLCPLQPGFGTVPGHRAEDRRDHG